MSAPGAELEVEVKLRLESAEEGRRLLRRAGFRVTRRRVLEDNTVFDTVEGRLRAGGELLRLRRSGGSSLLTYKGPADTKKYKSRQEVQLVLPDAETFRAILDHLGFRPAFRYQKYRTEYACGKNRRVVTLDETPIGVFLELEGDPRWIDRTAALLGFGEQSYITDSYWTLYRSHCLAQGLQVGDMASAYTPLCGH